MNPDTSRRTFLRQAGQFGLAGLPLGGMLSAGCARAVPARAGTGQGYGPLRPVADATTGLPLLRLPEGFAYRTFGWTGTALEGGFRTPGNHDGMGIVRAEGTRLTLVRNHEINTDTGAFGPDALAFDPKAGGGCIAFEFDTASNRVSGERCVLNGTAVNCAGGVTPWGTWLSGEEVVYAGRRTIERPDKPSVSRGWQTDHGFLFEAHPDGDQVARPILAAGMFKHEAAAVHVATGTVYLTEDNVPEAGFYRLLPKTPGRLHEGGSLQMLAAKGRTDLRRGLKVGQRFDVTWVDIAEPTRGHSPGRFDGRGVFAQGRVQGGTAFSRGEGLCIDGDVLWFTCTEGGDAGRGQIFALNVREQVLTLVYEASARAELDMPDNLVVSPQGALLVCEDNDQGRPQRLVGMDREGRTFVFCENNVDLRRFDMPGMPRADFRWEEWAGVCFSPDGRWLFANVYAPGFTVAITGPWADGPL